MKKIIDIVKDIFPFEYSVAGQGNDDSIKVFKKFLNFEKILHVRLEEYSLKLTV